MVRIAISQNYSWVLQGRYMKIRSISCELRRSRRRKSSYKNSDHLTWWHMKTFVTCEEPTFADDILSRFYSKYIKGQNKTFLAKNLHYLVVGTYLLMLTCFCCIVLVLVCIRGRNFLIRYRLLIEFGVWSLIFLEGNPKEV